MRTWSAISTASAFLLVSRSHEVWPDACENLVEIDERNEIVPWLASRQADSENSMVCTIELERGVRFKEGTPPNAAAVKSVFDEILTRKFVRGAPSRRDPGNRGRTQRGSLDARW
ncbi:MAG: hypothetical protein ACRD3V_08940 [Vicinamibacteria bacterium]